MEIRSASLIEDKINREILPRLKGYEPGDKFVKKITDLDDPVERSLCGPAEHVFAHHGILNGYSNGHWYEVNFVWSAA